MYAPVRLKHFNVHWRDCPSQQCLVVLTLTEQEEGSLHVHRGCSGAKGYGVAVAPSDTACVQPPAEKLPDQLHHQGGSCRSGTEHHGWRQKGKQLL